MIEAKVTGLPDLREALRGIVPKLRVRALRNALAAGARLVQRAARAATPVISASSLAVRKGYRTPGLVRKAISVRTSKIARRNGDVGVFVNVRPAKGAKFRTSTTKVLGLKFRSRTQTRKSDRGAKNPKDPFYWRFINFGTRKGVRDFGFLEEGARQFGAALEVFKAQLRPQIEKLNKPKAPAP
jgi:HK97 gp10 family phage protein